MVFLPSTKILKGDELPTYKYEQLFNSGIVSDIDKIEFVYSESPESVVEAGQVLTDTHLIFYGASFGCLATFKLSFLLLYR